MNKVNFGVFNLSDEEGENESEKILMKLCRKSFLSLWSFANTHTDEDMHSTKNSAKEFCDVIVIFEKDIIIFSDKHIGFHEDKDIKTIWKRWHKKAVIKSKKQLIGAKKWIKKFPNRIYIDATCLKKLPIEIPSEPRIHLVAVTRGTREASLRHYEDSWGSHILYANIDNKYIIENLMFAVDQTYLEGNFCHVFDETSLELIMHEFNTINDFINYLIAREEFFKKTKTSFILNGEEVLIASYFNIDSSKNNNSLLSIPETSSIVIYDNENLYLKMTSSSSYNKYHEKVKQSYIIDDLIERFIRLGDPNLVISKKKQTNQDLVLAMNLLASEPRVNRITIADELRKSTEQAKRRTKLKFMRCFMHKEQSDRCYCFVFIARDKGSSDHEYREKRIGMLHLYAVSIGIRYPQLKNIITLGFDHPNDHAMFPTEDLLVFLNDTGEWDSEEKRKIAELESNLGIKLRTIEQSI
ncbi:hypothetical protein [Acinetobacter sp.]|uniref:hypothetical protein n=1 Tax=Acinetobacter sp. TaxID=472 RepID=UPI0031D827F0